MIEKKSFRLRKIISLVLFFLFIVTKVYAFELNDVFDSISLNCIDLRVIGVCVKPPGITGIVITYWEPALLIETVKQPGNTVIESLKPVLSGLVTQATNNLAKEITGLSIQPSSGSNTTSLSQTNLQFNDVHIYDFPFRDQIMSFIDVECPDKIPSGAFVKYLSELDFLEWRIGVTESLQPETTILALSGPACAALSGLTNNTCMGFWGAVYPRRGFVTHQSEVVGSAVAAVRAVSIASPLNSAAHVVLESAGFMPSFKDDRLQLIYPKPSTCIKIGENPIFWESGKTSPDGNYLWIYWRKRTCCIY